MMGGTLLYLSDVDVSREYCVPKPGKFWQECFVDPLARSEPMAESVFTVNLDSKDSHYMNIEERTSRRLMRRTWHLHPEVSLRNITQVAAARCKSAFEYRYRFGGF